ncbi:MAG: tetratricopeptide repeat protein [Betaproteobacteria bacterium]|nr:MAG: tetratricopeptide repeat protein [Betaproteobacteria bacterium]
MSQRATLGLFVAAGLALLAACVQQPGKPIAARAAEAIEANRRAELRFRSGDLEGAVQHYREALRIAQSIEDVEGIAANAINLSIAYQRLGKHAEARASLASVLDHSRLNFPRARLAQAALRRALLDLEQGRHADAAAWLEQAANWCGQQGCTLLAAIRNAEGLLALAEGRTDAAAASARAALEASRGAGNRVEAANAMRLLGNVAIRAGDAAAALAMLAEALAIDRELALPRKIYLDLVGLGRASAQGGERARARAYYERALAVSEADRDAAGAAEARDLIRGLGNIP